jgi:hypothetical protein
MTPLTPAERDALRLRAEKADEVFSGRTVGELILDVRNAHVDASEGLLGAALDAILAQCIAEPFEPWPGSLVAALVAPEQLAETRVPPAVMELQTEVHLSRQRQQEENLQDVSRVGRATEATAGLEAANPKCRVDQRREAAFFTIDLSPCLRSAATG